MIKLIATDLDGTLFYPKKRLTLMSGANRDFLSDFIGHGGRVVLVSGRNSVVLPKVEKKVGYDMALLGCNGSFLIEHRTLKKEHPLPNEVMVEIYSKLKNNFGIIAWFLFNDSPNLYITFHGVTSLYLAAARVYNWSLGVYHENFVLGEKKFVRQLATGKNFKLMPIFGVTSKAYVKARQAFMAIDDLYNDKVTVCCTDNALEFTAYGINKAVGLKEYIKDLGLSEDEVAVVGDSGNDVVMFDNFVHSFCMKRGEKSIKEHAKYEIDRVSDLKNFIDKL